MPVDASRRSRLQLRLRPDGRSVASRAPESCARKGEPVEQAPGWRIFRSPFPDDSARRRPRFGLVAVAAAWGAAAIVFGLALDRGHWREPPAEGSMARSMPPGAISPGGPQATSAAAASQAKADPAPSADAAAAPLESLEALDAPIAGRQSHPRPHAGAPSAGRSRASVHGSPPSARASHAAPLEPGRPSPQSAVAPATPPSAARLQASTAASFLDDRSALPAGGIRVFIHHVANHEGDAALARRVADHLRQQGFTVADVRPVDLSIGKPSVRYFFARDRAPSRRLVDELGRFFEAAPSRAPDQASDFAHFTPKPRPGNVEVWLPES